MDGMKRIVTAAMVTALTGFLLQGEAAQAQPGAAGAAHQPQEDLVAHRAAGDQAGGVVYLDAAGERGEIRRVPVTGAPQHSTLLADGPLRAVDDEEAEEIGRRLVQMVDQGL